MKFISILAIFTMALGASAVANPARRAAVIDVAELEQRSGGISQSTHLPI